MFNIPGQNNQQVPQSNNQHPAQNTGTNQYQQPVQNTGILYDVYGNQQQVNTQNINPYTHPDMPPVDNYGGMNNAQNPVRMPQDFSGINHTNHADHRPNNVQSTVITQLVIIEGEPIKRTPFKRHMDTNVSTGELKHIEKVFTEQGVHQNSQLSDIIVANNLGSVCSLSHHVTEQANIINGWDTRRCRYFLEAVTPKQGYDEVAYVQGYTDGDNISIGDNLREDSIFYINSMMIFRRSSLEGRVSLTPICAFNVHHDKFGSNAYEDITSSIMSGNTLIRPQDIMTDITHNTEAASGVTSMSTVSTSGKVSGEHVGYSGRSNLNGSMYLNKVISAFVSSKSGNADTNLIHNIHRDAKLILKEPGEEINGFLSTVMSMTNDPHPVAIPFQILKSMNPSLDKVTLPIKASQVGTVGEAMRSIRHSNVLTAEDTEHHHIASIETTIAAKLVASISGIMGTHMCTRFACNLNNLTGRYDVMAVGVKTFINGMDDLLLMNNVRNGIASITMPELLKEQGQDTGLLIDATVDIDMLSSTTIGISVNQGPIVVFRYPTFADALFSSMMSDTAHRSKVVNDIDNIITAALPTQDIY